MISNWNITSLTDYPVDREDDAEPQDVPRHHPELVPHGPVLPAGQVILLAPDVAVLVRQASRSILVWNVECILYNIFLGFVWFLYCCVEEEYKIFIAAYMSILLTDGAYCSCYLFILFLPVSKAWIQMTSTSRKNMWRLFILLVFNLRLAVDHELLCCGAALVGELASSH